MLKLIDYCAMLILSEGVVYLFQVTCRRTHFLVVISHSASCLTSRYRMSAQAGFTSSMTESWQRILGNVEQPLEDIGCVLFTVSYTSVPKAQPATMHRYLCH